MTNDADSGIDGCGGFLAGRLRPIKEVMGRNLVDRSVRVGWVFPLGATPRTYRNEVAVPDRAFRQAASRGFFNWLVIKQVVPITRHCS
jgi:hypothetical protein